MHKVKAVGGKRLALATAIASVLALSGCSTMPSAFSVRPLQSAVGLAGHGALTGDYAQGREHFRAGRYGLALEAFQKDLARHPQSVAALNAIGAVYDKLGRYDLAVSHYYRALQLDPDSVAVLGNLGYSFLLQGRPEAASGVLKLAAAIDPGNAVVAGNLAMAEAQRLAIKSEQPMPPAPVVKSPSVQPDAVSAVAQSGPRKEAQEPVAKVVTALAVEPEGNSTPPVQEMPEGPVAVAGASSPSSESAAALVEASAMAAPVAPAADRPAAAKVETVRVPDVPEAVVAAPEVQQRPAVAVIYHEMPQPARTITADNGRVDMAFTVPEGTVEISNGNGYEGMAGLLSRYYTHLGQQVAHVTNAAHFNHVRTVIFYRAGKRDVAEALSADLPLKAVLRESPSIRTDARLVLGKDIGFYQDAIRRMSLPGEAGPGSFAALDAHIEVSNGNGRRGMAGLLARVLGHHGETVSRVTNADNFLYPVTRIFYAPGKERQAKALASRLPVDAELVARPTGALRRDVDVRLIIGHDFLHYEQVMQGLLVSKLKAGAGA